MAARTGPIGEVVVAGGGIVGWSAAAALKHRIPALSVTVVATDVPDDALADRIGITLPSIHDFHRDVGISEADVVARIGCTYRLGTRFEGWTQGGEDYVHAYGEYGRPLGTTSFYLHWIRAAKTRKVAAFDRHSPGAAIGTAGRFVHPRGEPGSPLAGFTYALRFDPGRYREMMRAYALHLGVAERTAGIAEVKLDGEDGFVESLRLEDGGEARGDLFVDATGPRASVRVALDDDPVEDWSPHLLGGRVLFASAPAAAEPPSLDKAAALRFGWRWEAALPDRVSHGLVYAAGTDDSKAARALEAAGAEPAGPPTALRQGARTEPWRRNCVAIGDAAVAIEPLEWTNLHLAHSMIDRLVAKMPNRDCGAVELWDYNRESLAEARRARDFVLLHYVAARREKDAFWRAAATVLLPDSLAHSLDLFRERGRLPLYEEETFTRDSWAAVLLGQGVIPRRIDPIIDAIPADQADKAMSQIRKWIEEIVPTLPTQADYLRQIAASAGGRR